MKKITIEIPDETAEKVETYLKSLRSNQPVQRGDDVVFQLLYPNGLDDWIPDLVSENLLRLPCVGELPEVQAEDDAIRQANDRKKGLMRPQVVPAE